MTATAVVLAAGKGTRLRSPLPKVLHDAAGRSLLSWVLHAVHGAGIEHVVVVVGHEADAVSDHAQSVAAEIGITTLQTVLQAEQNGTGHAVRMAQEAGALEEATEVLVLPGDVPGITADSVRALRDARRGPVALMTAVLDDATGYGRIIRSDSDRILAIVEHKDATEQQRAIREINTGLMAFDADALRGVLHRLGTDNAQGEEYLTDTIELLASDGIDPVVVDAQETAGINDRAQLAEVAAVLRQRRLVAIMRDGVTVMDPATTYVDAEVMVGHDATLLPGTILQGRTSIGAGATVGPNTRLIDCEVGEEATVTYTVATGASIGPGATVGPYTHLRPGTVLGRGAKAGGFVEMKKATIGDGSKVPHLSYIGDATIGDGVNVGAATITCNYDGANKHHTKIGDGAFVGSATMLVAPVEIGQGAYTAAGSTVTKDVPADALAVERAEQRNIEGWAARKRKRDSA